MENSVNIDGLYSLPRVVSSRIYRLAMYRAIFYSVKCFIHKIKTNLIIFAFKITVHIGHTVFKFETC